MDGAYSSGSVSVFSGASGLLQALLDFVCGTKVEDAATTGSGAGPYTASLSTPVGLGSCIINYTISSVDYTAIADGDGLFSGTGISSGSINEETGAFTVTFTGTPDSAPTVDYVYGDEGQDWELKLQRTTRDNVSPGYSEPHADCDEVILHNRGITGEENVLIGIREWFNAGAGLYAWDLTGYMQFTSGMDWFDSLNDIDNTYYSSYDCFSHCPQLPLANTTMNYWFYSNRQRIIVIVRVGTSYESCYLGFANRYATKEEYPYPLVIKGSGSYYCSVSETNIYRHSFIPFQFFDRLNYASYDCYLMHNILPDNTWSINWDYYSGGYAYLQTTMFPLATWVDRGNIYPIPGWREEILSSPVIGYNIQRNQTLWELDGVKHLAGYGLSSEDYIRHYDKEKYRIFQDTYRTDYNLYMGIDEESYTTTTTTA